MSAKVEAIPEFSAVQRLRMRRSQVGLKRVEVYVPRDKVDLLKAYVAQLSAESESERLLKVRKLVGKAYEKYGASCLDNVSVVPARANFSDAAVVAAALIHRGNIDAYRLGREINALVK